MLFPPLLDDDPRVGKVAWSIDPGTGLHQKTGNIINLAVSQLLRIVMAVLLLLFSVPNLLTYLSEWLHVNIWIHQRGIALSHRHAHSITLFFFSFFFVRICISLTRMKRVAVSWSHSKFQKGVHISAPRTSQTYPSFPHLVPYAPPWRFVTTAGILDTLEVHRCDTNAQISA